MTWQNLEKPVTLRSPGEELSLFYTETEWYKVISTKAVRNEVQRSSQTTQ